MYLFIFVYLFSVFVYLCIIFVYLFILFLFLYKLFHSFIHREWNPVDLAEKPLIAVWISSDNHHYSFHNDWNIVAPAIKAMITVHFIHKCK